MYLGFCLPLVTKLPLPSIHFTIKTKLKVIIINKTYGLSYQCFLALLKIQIPIETFDYLEISYFYKSLKIEDVPFEITFHLTCDVGD